MLSIIIVHYDTPELTGLCLESLFTHTKDVEFEVILVDNASPNTDPNTLVDRFPTVKLVKASSNLGFATGNNLGLDRAKGDAILLLNSDVILEEDAVGKTFRRLTMDPRVDVISPRLTYPDGTLQHTCRRLPSIGLLLLEVTRLHKLMSPETRAHLLSGTYFAHDTECEVESVWAAFFMFKRKILRAFPSGRLPATFFMYGEDAEWCLLLKRAGARILFYPEATAIHMLSASSGFADDNPRKLKLIEENRQILLRRYRGRAYAEVYRAIRWLARRPG